MAQTFNSYKKKIKALIDKDMESDIPAIMSALSPKDRVKMRKEIDIYKYNKREKEHKKFKKYQDNKTKAYRSTVSKTKKALYDSRRRRTAKSGKSILKGFGLA